MPAERFVGKPVKRTEDIRFLLGKSRYVDDLKLDGVLSLSILRSTYPHAILKSVDLSGALQRRGVIACLSGRDIAESLRPLPFLAAPPSLKKRPIYPLAIDKVRFVGEAVACVVAENRYVGDDSLESIRAEYAPLEPVLNTERAAASSSLLLFGEWDSNIALSTQIERGDLDGAFKRADYVLEERLAIQRQYGAPIEPRAVVASFHTANSSLTVWSTTQWPHVLRTILAECLKLPENRVRVVAPDVGGGFGSKQDIYPEEILASFLSIKFRRPVEWVATRREELASTVHAREQIHYLKLAFDKEGRILGLQDKIIADIGACHTLSAGPQLLTMSSLTGPYKIPACKVELLCVVTNKAPVGANRGFGQPKSTFVIERAIDMAAGKLGIDPMEVRMRNLIQPTEFPFETILGPKYDSGDYPACLKRALEISRYSEFRRRQAEARKNEEHLGIGLAFYVESAGIGPSHLMGQWSYKYYSGHDSASVRLTPSGKILITSGISPHGQGTETILKQICADELSVNIEDIEVIFGDTALTPYGFGTWGSRGAVVAGTAVLMSCRKLREKILKIASYLLQCDVDRLRLEEGCVLVEGSADMKLPLSDVAREAYMAHRLPSGVGPGLEETTFYDPPGLTFSYGTHVAKVRVDVETGKTRILEYYVVHDCGRIVNPLIVEGQTHGGVAQGIGGTLLEEITYDESGQLLTSTFMDYLIPTASDVPTIIIDHLETLSPHNPLGMKGMGEGPAIAPPAAITNAVADALSPFDVKLAQTPLTAEQLWRRVV